MRRGGQANRIGAKDQGRADASDPGDATTSNRRVQLVDFRAQVTAPADILAGLDLAYPPDHERQAAGNPLIGSRLEVRRLGQGHGPYRIVRDESIRWETDDAGDLVGPLDWAIIDTALEDLAGRYVTFHGGAVARGGGAILLPACSGSGKTTLVAGLVAAGYQYLSDEVGVFEPTTRTLRAFPRALSLKEGSLPILTPLFPALMAAPRFTRFGREKVVYLAPPADSWTEAPVPVRAVVIPSYEAGAPTSLQPISRSVALQTLLEQSFSAHQQGARALTACVDLLRGADCYHLRIGGLSDAVALLSSRFRA